MRKITKTLAAAAAATALLFSGAAPATAAPAPQLAATTVAPTLGLSAGAYAFWCMLGYCKTTTVCDRTIGCQKVICANRACTRFIFG